MPDRAMEPLLARVAVGLRAAIEHAADLGEEVGNLLAHVWRQERWIEHRVLHHRLGYVEVHRVEEVDDQMRRWLDVRDGLLVRTLLPVHVSEVGDGLGVQLLALDRLVCLQRLQLGHQRVQVR